MPSAASTTPRGSRPTARASGCSTSSTPRSSRPRILRSGPRSSSPRWTRSLSHQVSAWSRGGHADLVGGPQLLAPRDDHAEWSKLQPQSYLFLCSTPGGKRYLYVLGTFKTVASLKKSYPKTFLLGQPVPPGTTRIPAMTHLQANQSGRSQIWPMMCCMYVATELKISPRLLDPGLAPVSRMTAADISNVSCSDDMLIDALSSPLPLHSRAKATTRWSSRSRRSSRPALPSAHGPWIPSTSRGCGPSVPPQTRRWVAS